MLAQPLTGKKRKKRKEKRPTRCFTIVALRFRGTAFLARLHTPSSRSRAPRPRLLKASFSTSYRHPARVTGGTAHASLSNRDAFARAYIVRTYVYKDAGTLVSRSHTCSRFMRAPHAPHNSTDGKLLKRPFASRDSQPAVLFFFFLFSWLAGAIFPPRTRGRETDEDGNTTRKCKRS